MYYEIGSRNPTFLQCYGISKNKVTDEYVLVIQYAPMGSLRQNLFTIAQMSWEMKLELLTYISFDLQLIHSYNIIHRDLHSGNIFQNNIYNAYIGDLGFAKLANKILKTESGGVYGALPYIAPEVLNGKSFTKASDVYSLGIIMWEISSGKIAFSDYEHDNLSLTIEICEGLRPKIIKGITPCYRNLLERCWNSNPKKRPSALEVYETIMSWKNDTNILSKFKKSDKEIEIKNYNFDANNDGIGIYSSKFISFVNKQLITDQQQSNKYMINRVKSVNSDNIMIEDIEKVLKSIE
ncbi:kinase-like domain-containing protein [Gigaspora rosea]|uniref:Kinase-like domain-containing protein n=1 Tax=Gigaspora rosea TaxID=44941 RepID=A0A397TUF9_9GLOM|nr:kinase-like domain-containing protein [Gigaspora rosea]